MVAGIARSRPPGRLALADITAVRRKFRNDFPGRRILRQSALVQQDLILAGGAVVRRGGPEDREASSPVAGRVESRGVVAASFAPGQDCGMKGRQAGHERENEKAVTARGSSSFDHFDIGARHDGGRAVRKPDLEHADFAFRRNGLEFRGQVRRPRRSFRTAGLE